MTRGTLAVFFRNIDKEQTLVSRVVVEVTDPTSAWQATPDPEQPVKSLVEKAETELTESDQPIGELSAEPLDQALSSNDIVVESVTVRSWRKRTYEVETASGDWYEIGVKIDEGPPEGGTTMTTEDEVVLAALRDALADIDDHQQLDLTTLADTIDHPAIDVEIVNKNELSSEQSVDRETE